MDTWNNNFNPLNMNMNMGTMQPRYIPPAPRYEIIKVNGEAGARNFRMAPNSNALLLDETAAIVWFAQTDGTGYLTVTPYSITPYQPAPQVNINDLATRVAQLEEIVNNAQSNSFSNKRSKKPNHATVEPANDATN